MYAEQFKELQLQTDFEKDQIVRHRSLTLHLQDDASVVREVVVIVIDDEHRRLHRKFLGRPDATRPHVLPEFFVRHSDVQHVSAAQRDELVLREAQVRLRDCDGGVEGRRGAARAGDDGHRRAADERRPRVGRARVGGRVVRAVEVHAAGVV